MVVFTVVPSTGHLVIGQVLKVDCIAFGLKFHLSFQSFQPREVVLPKEDELSVCSGLR